MKQGRLMAIVLAVVSLGAIGLTGCGGSKREAVPPVAVPNLIGKGTLRAQALLRERGLRWRWDDSVKAGTANGFIPDSVESQSPVPGQWVKPGTVVQIGPGDVLTLTPTPYG